MDRFLRFNFIAEHRERFERNRYGLRRARIFRERENPLDTLNDDNFFQRFRMTRPRFYDLLSCVHDELEHSTKRNHALLPSLQLMTGLRFFACGSFQQVIGGTLKIDKSKVCRTITRVTKALLKLRNEMIYWPSEEECASIATELCNSHNFPCVAGLIDGTHIKVLRPKEHEAAFVNRKDYHSINVQVCGN